MMKEITINNHENIIGYQVSTMGGEETIGQLLSWINSGEKGKICICANPHSLVEANKDPAFEQVFHGADLVIPDGMGIVLASRILGGAIGERVTGSDIFKGLSDALNSRGGNRYFFHGSTEATLTAIKKKMAMEYPHIQVAGSFSPPYAAEFSEEENRLMVEAVNAAQPDVLWVAMTAPKQEKWIWQHRHSLHVPCIGAIGAVFDFYAGNIKRSHPLFQRMGLEWLPRLLQEPKRLFKRNFVSSPLFIREVIWQKFGLK